MAGEDEGGNYRAGAGAALLGSYSLHFNELCDFNCCLSNTYQKVEE
jgi:hypothetical protein